MISERGVGPRLRRMALSAGEPAQVLAEARAVARDLLDELTKMDCELTVAAIALAVLLGAVVVQLPLESKENFYRDFLRAARASEADCASRHVLPRQTH